MIEWAKQMLYPDDADPYDDDGRRGDRCAAGRRRPTFLPYLLGERAPVWDSNARGVFFGLGATTAAPT